MGSGAMIGNNLINKLTYDNCTISNAAGGALFGSQITGGTASGPASKYQLHVGPIVAARFGCA
jgi:hypothetical protein